MFDKNKIKRSYTSYGVNNIAESLIVPCLKKSKLYRRSVGFFSSSVLGMIFEGLQIFIKNGGKIQLVISPELSVEDIETIEHAEQDKKDNIKNKIIDLLEEDLSNAELNDIDILYQLIIEDILEIKIALVNNDFGIYHDKLGIFTDFNNNNIVFYGSANSSKNAYFYNYEKIRVVNSFNEYDIDSINDEINEFDNLWNNNNKYLEVYSFMDAIKNSVIKIRNKRLDEKKDKPGPKHGVELFKHQVDAINNWVDNDYKGFYVMATGTGKTWTALYSAKKLLEKYESLVVIIAPYKHLVKQWYIDTENLFGEATIIMISSENTNWENSVKQAIIQQKLGIIKQIILISTIKSFCSSKFNNVIKRSLQEKLLIADEAHRFTNRPSNLKNIYKYRLGLSATPFNGKDADEGKKLLSFFGGKVYDLPIDVALKNKMLVPYNYYTFYVTPTDSEIAEFNDITKKMGYCFKNNILIDKDKLNILCRKRLQIISMLSEKMDSIDDFIRSISEKDHFIVYCGDGKINNNESEEIRHLMYVKTILNDLQLKTCQFTCAENMDRREQIVNMFNNGEIDSLVAIKCLDEGINIPSIKSALILSSNDNYREFVQRRGRILRKYHNKDIANIYDVIALPDINCTSMAKIELRRFYEYAKLANNSSEKLIELENLLCKYNLKLTDIEMYNEYEYEGELDD